MPGISNAHDYPSSTRFHHTQNMHNIKDYHKGKERGQMRPQKTSRQKVKNKQVKVIQEVIAM